MCFFCDIQCAILRPSLKGRTKATVIRDNAYKLMSHQAVRAAQANGRLPAVDGTSAVDVSAVDFDEE